MHFRHKYTESGHLVLGEFNNEDTDGIRVVVPVMRFYDSTTAKKLVKDLNTAVKKYEEESEPES